MPPPFFDVCFTCYIDTHSIWLFSFVCFCVSSLLFRWMYGWLKLPIQPSNPSKKNKSLSSAKVDLTDGVAKECRFLAYNRNLVLQSRILFCIYIYIVKFSDLFLDMMEFTFSSVSFLFKLPHKFWLVWQL